MTTDRPLRIGITGARGFIGRNAVEHFASRGWETHAYQRDPAASPRDGVRTHRFVMPDGIDERSFEGLDVLIHGALVEYGPAHRDADRINLAAAERVRDIARRHDIRVIFLSTLSAHAAARSHYGRNKLELESVFDARRDTILRLGLVLGNGGLFGSMVDVVRGSAVIPLPDGGRQPIQTLWMGDLLDVLERVAARGLAGRYDLATAEVYTMRQVYETVMRGLSLRRTLVPVPLALVGFGVATLERLRVPFSINSENVLGLQCLRAFDNARDLAALEVEPLSLDASVARLLRASA
jgi:nucleoside-diphosphate-sugar epimerase